MIGAHDGFEADVAGFRQQDRTDTYRQLRHPRFAFTDVGTFIGEARSRLDFQQQLRQIDAWQQIQHAVAQSAETGRFFEPVESAEDQGVTALERFHTHRLIR